MQTINQATMNILFLEELIDTGIWGCSFYIYMIRVVLQAGETEWGITLGFSFKQLNKHRMTYDNKWLPWWKFATENVISICCYF